MASLLLVIIYIAFIGLGIPDSLFGTAWPAIYTEFSLPISCGSFVTVIIPCGTIISSLLSSRVISRFGTGKVTAFSTGLTALALLGFSCSGSLVALCLCAVPLGLGAGAVDTALNNYVALHYSAVHMSFLHCFYGVGVSLSPYVLSLVISGPAGWRGGYRIAFMIQLVLGAAVVILLLPLSPYISAAGLFLVGLGNGPLFPNFNYLTPENFGADVSQSVIGFQMAASYVGIMLMTRQIKRTLPKKNPPVM